MNALDGIEPRYHAVIIGARVAGAATALLLARMGARVLVVDRQAYGSDTMSTHALMRSAVIQLRRWNLTERLEAAGTPPIRSTSFHYGDETVRIDIKPDHGVEHLYAPRRTVLDRVLVDAAREAGADVRHGVALSDCEVAPDGRVVGVSLKDASGAGARVRAEIVIGADGRQSSLAQFVDAQAYVECVHAAGVVYGYYEKLSQEGLHWHFAENAAAGVIPTNGGHCVFAAVPALRFAETFRGDVTRAFLSVLEANRPSLRADVERGAPIGRLRGYAGAVGYLRQCHGPGWALVGDAGYFKDPLTAHGITDALRDAELLSQAVALGTPRAFDAYQQERDALSLPLLRATDAIASFSWSFDEVKELHKQLSAAMKAEANHVASLVQPPSPQRRRQDRCRRIRLGHGPWPAGLRQALSPSGAGRPRFAMSRSSPR